MQIQVLSAQVSTRNNKAGKPMQVLEVAYKNLTFQGKVESKQLFDFGVQKDTFKALAVATTGQVYEIDVVKNDAGYNDWVKISKSDGTGSAQTVATLSPPSGQSAGVATTSPRSTYETPEERAKKQIYIVRQSSISNAIDLLTTGAKNPPKIEDVIDAAKQFEDFIFGTGKTESVVSGDVSTGIEDLESDVPY